MKAIQDISALFGSTNEVVLGEEECDCGEVVQVIETIMPFGPKKGEKEILRRGCRCEDIALENEFRELKQRMEQQKFETLFHEQSLVNDNLKEATFKNYNPITEAQRDLRKELAYFAHNFSTETRQSFLITGTYGIGKSHLAYATAQHVMSKGFKALFISVPMLLTKIKSTYSKESEVGEDELLQYIADVDLLVLDDLGAEHKSASGWVQSKLFEVIDRRSGKSNIYTTNLTSEELMSDRVGVGPRNFSRMMQNAKVYRLDGIDYRLKDFMEG